MKRLSFFVLVVLQQSFSQSVEVTYSINIDGSGFESPKKEVLDAMANWVKIASNIKTCLLISGNKSSFLVLENIAPDEGEYDAKTAIMAFVSSKDVYTDLDNNKVYCKENDGTATVTKLTRLDWELSNETKIIDQFTCFKAILKQNVIGRLGNKLVLITEAWYAPALPYALDQKNLVGYQD